MKWMRKKNYGTAFEYKIIPCEQSQLKRTVIFGTYFFHRIRDFQLSEHLSEGLISKKSFRDKTLTSQFTTW